MMENLLDDLEAFKALIHAPPKYIVTFTHKNPDGDAIGSSLGMKGYLETFGHTVRAILPSDYPKLFDFLPGMDDVLIAEYQHDACRNAIQMADMFICLDFNALDRMDWLAQEMLEAKKTTVLIDHHIDPEPFADLLFSDTTASSTSELVFHLIDEMGDFDRIDLDIAEKLYTGILTDTGSYRFGTSARLFSIASHLKHIGVDDYLLNIRLFNNMTEKQLRLLGHCLANRMEVLDDLSTGIIYLTRDDFRDFSIARGDTEGIVNYILMMRHIRVAVFLTEQNHQIKLSFRSKGNVSVQYLAQKYFHGGGHKNASGGASRKSLEETLRYLKEILPEFIEKQLRYA